jgi:SAM-dependent MidA family methyltransferase
VHDDALFLPGAQDLTAAVDFTAVAEAALAAGFDLAGYTTQAHFLLACGIETELAAIVDPVQRYSAAQEAKRLLLPSAMGETCKLMALACARTVTLGGFAHDQRARLAGYAR